jgi:hypothetical protein
MRLPRLDYGAFVGRGVSPPVARFLSAAKHPIPSLDILVRPLSAWDYFIPPGVQDVVGLWDDNADAFVRWKRGGEIEYVLLAHDDPEPVLVAHTEQGLLADLTRRYHEMLDWSDEEAAEELVRQCAEYIGFRHVEPLLDYLAESGDETGDFAEEFRGEFGSLE